MPTPDERLVAQGTWTRRGSSLTVPTLSPEDLTAGPDGAARDAFVAAPSRIAGGEGTRRVLGRLSLTAAAAELFRRYGETWSVSTAAHRAERFLAEVAEHCWAERAWSAQLAERFPTEIADQARALAARAERMRRQSTFEDWHEAHALTRPSQDEVRAIAAHVELAYRSFPGRVFLPAMRPRLTNRSRVRGLEVAVTRYDELVTSWYGFAFSSAVPDDHALRLEHLAAEPGVGPALDAAQRCRAACRRAATAATVASARAGVRSLGAAIAELEEALRLAADRG